jgi:L,D-transpeptidase catalytic domain
MRRLALALIAVALWCGGFASARAEVSIVVDKTAQSLTVEVNGSTRYQWPVSTARWGYRTPNGNYRPQRLERQWYSRKYDWSPMPYSIFFAGGYAIHGSNEVSRLGRPASHGCIRLHPQNAAVLFELVRQNPRDTHITVTGAGPELYASPRKTRAGRFVEDLAAPRGEPAGTRYSFEQIFDAPAGRTYNPAPRRTYR